MKEEKKGSVTIIDRAKLEALLKERREILVKVESNLVALNQEQSRQNEQAIGLRHRINELQELLK